MAKAALTFGIYQNDQLVRQETVVQDVIKIGQDPRSHLHIDDPSAARMHAVIEVSDINEITLIDLGNDPGTMVNGAVINKCRLNVDDQVQIGGTLIVFESIQPMAQPPVAHSQAPQQPVSQVPQPPMAPVEAAPVQPAPAAPAVPAAGGQTLIGGTAAAMQPPQPPPPEANPFAQQVAAAAPENPFAEGAAANPFGGGAAPSPFGAAATVAHDAPEGTYTYQLLKSGPDVSPDEVELPHVASVEVMVMWGENVLHVSHLTPPRNFYVGEEQGKAFAVDFFIPSEKLGTTRMPVVMGDKSSAAVVIPQGAVGSVEIEGQPAMSLEQVAGQTQPCAELAGAQQLPLPAGAKVRVQVNDMVFQVQTVNAGKPMPHGLASGFDWNVAMYFGLSFLSIGSLMLAMAFFVPPMGLTDGEGLDQDQLILIQQYLNAAAEREQEEEETEQAPEENADNREGGTGTKAKGEEGQMGKESSQDTNKRYAVQGPKDNPDPHLARQAALREAVEFGMIGLINTGATGDPNAPTAPWGRETSLGMDEVSAMGNMWGDEIGDAYGAGGLGLTGIGEGGGGRGEGIGLGSIGTLGHGAGTGTGQGFGSGHGRLGGSHRTKAPRVRMGATTVSGRLPKEVIQRIIRQNFGRFRLCYEKGLATNPNLEGRVSARFVINRDGSVSNVGNGGSSLPDSGVVNCVIRAFYGLSFPKPEGGIVTVVYPIMFSPG